MMAGLLGGGGGGATGASVGNTAQQIGLAVQDRLKDVLKWF